MGNCCSGGKEESKKAAAFQTSDDSDAVFPVSSNDPNAFSPSGLEGLDNNSVTINNNAQQVPPAANSQQQDAATALQKKQGEAQLKKMREEQNRLDLIVQMAGRGMVSVRSTRGSTGYYDQGFAAALGQHLEQTTKFPDQLPIRLPPSTQPTSSKKDAATSASSSPSNAATAAKQHTVFQRLSQPQWENIALGKKGNGLAGCGGENPNTYMDHVAVSFLDKVVPKKERIFHGGVGPMVENLL